MHLRNYKGKIVYINEKNYPSEKLLYIQIWKIKYNLDIAKKTSLNDIFDYVDGKNFFF